MSVAALILVYGYFIFSGTPNTGGDEGIAARIFQLLLVGQIPIILYFAIKWVPKVPRESLRILVIQVFAALSTLGLVVFLER